MNLIRLIPGLLQTKPPLSMKANEIREICSPDPAWIGLGCDGIEETNVCWLAGRTVRYLLVIVVVVVVVVSNWPYRITGRKVQKYKNTYLNF